MPACLVSPRTMSYEAAGRATGPGWCSKADRSLRIAIAPSPIPALGLRQSSDPILSSEWGSSVLVGGHVRNEGTAEITMGRHKIKR